MQEEPKPTPKPKKKLFSKRVPFAFLAVLFIAVIAICIFAIFINSKSDSQAQQCLKVLKNSEDLTKEKKYPESRTYLVDNSDKCDQILQNATKKPDKSSAFIAIEYGSQAAKSASISGDQAEATKYANLTLEAVNKSAENKSIEDKDRNNVVNNAQDMYKIKNGYFTENSYVKKED